MATSIPVRLGKEPLLEAIWEIRFSPAVESVAELLPGALFRALGGRFRNLVRLPGSYIPAPMSQLDPAVAFSPKIRLENDNQAILLGDKVLGLSCRRPYSGWAKFSADIRELAAVFRDSGLAKKVERFSLKYIDLLEIPQCAGLDCLNVCLSLAERKVSTEPVHIQTEIKENGLVHIVQVVSPAEAWIPGAQDRLKGVWVAIDSIETLASEDPWQRLEERLDYVHTACKKVFFELLKPDTLKQLEPQYG